MKRLFRYLLIIVLIFTVTIAAIASYLAFFLPNVGPAPGLEIEITEERIERGKYLANHVMLCMECHAVRDFSLFAGPPIPETLGAGGTVFDQKLGLPGSFVSENLTPYKMESWTDGELYRAIVSGVSKDGRALFPIMPYPNFAQVDEEDIYAVIAYLRTLEPIAADHPSSKADFPMSLIMNTIPAAPSHQPRPNKSELIDYGRYLVTAGVCNDCHTRIERGEFVGELYAGGNEFPMPDGSVVRAANITPHATGIGNWTEEQFVTRFKIYADTSYVPRTVQPGEFQTIMPWSKYAGMAIEDLQAIFAYLQSLPPVDNRVEIFSPAKDIN